MDRCLFSVPICFGNNFYISSLVIMELFHFKGLHMMTGESQYLQSSHIILTLTVCKFCWVCITLTLYIVLHNWYSHVVKCLLSVGLFAFLTVSSRFLDHEGTEMFQYT